MQSIAQCLAFTFNEDLTCSARTLQCQLTWAALQRSRGVRKDITYRDRKRGRTAVKSPRVTGTVSTSRSRQYLLKWFDVKTSTCKINRAGDK